VAADQLTAFFTYVAAHVVSAQLADHTNLGVGRNSSSAVDGDAGPLGSAGRAAWEHSLLVQHLSDVPVRDGDAWLAELSSKSPTLASRVGETRLAYGTDELGSGFEWDSLRRLVAAGLAEGNLAVMRNWAEKKSA